MAKEVKLPDGTTLSFPDDATIDEITAAVNSPEVEKLTVKPYEDAEAARPARMTVGLTGQVRKADDITPVAPTEPAPEPKGSLINPVTGGTERGDQGEFSRGFESGVSGAHQMGAAAGMTAMTSALGSLTKRLELYDAVDAGKWDAKSAAEARFKKGRLGATPSDAEQRAQLYAAAGPERRAEMRDEELRSVADHAEVRDALKETWDTYSAHIQTTTGATPNLTDVKDVQGFTDWLAFNVGQGIPYIAASTMTAALGSAVGGPAGATAALIASGTGMGVGDISSEQLEKGREINAERATAFAVPYGALDMLGPAARAFRGVSGPAAESVGKGFADWLKRTGKEAGKSSFEEFWNESGQEFLKDAALAQKGEPLLTEEAALRWFNAGAAGAAAGGTTSVATSAAADARGLISRPKPAEERAQVIAEELERAVNTTEFAQSAESIAVGLLNPAGASMRATVAPVLEATSTDEAIAAATAAATGQPTPVSTTPAASATLAGTATPSVADEQLFTDGANDDNAEAPGSDAPALPGAERTQRERTDQFNAGQLLRNVNDFDLDADGNGTFEGRPFVVVDPARFPEDTGGGDRRITRSQAAAIEELYAKSGKRVIFYGDHAQFPDGFLNQHQSHDVVFISDSPQKAGGFVAAHEFTHALDTMPDLADAVRAVVNREITADGIDMMQKRHGLKFPSDPVAQRAFLVKEAAADLGGWALSDPQFLPKVVEEVRARQGDEAATGVVKKLLGAITKAIKAVQRIFRQEPDLSAKVVTNLEAVRDALAKLYGAQYSSQIEIEKAKLEGLRRKNGPAYEVYDSATGRAVPGRRYPERSRAEIAAGTENLNEGTRARYKVREADVTKSPKVANAKREEYAGSHGQDQRTAGPQLQGDEDLHRSVAGGRPAEGWARATRIRRGDGQPLAVYRGAAAALAPEHFELGALGRASGNASSGLGVWFTVSAAEADTYGEREAFFLDIRKPFVIRVEDLPGFESVEAAHQWREGLRAAGHDGLLVTAKHLGGRVHVVAFDVQQVVRPADDITKSRKESGDDSLEAHVLRADRQARTEGARARLNEVEKAAAESASRESGIPARVIEATVREHKRAHPQSQGWAPLVFKGLKAPAEPGGKWTYEYQIVPYAFDKDNRGRRFEPGSDAYKRRVEGFSQRIADEVRAIHDRAQNGNTAARNIIRQAGWYRNMRDRLRREFGGLGDLFADLLGATSPNTPVRDNWSNASDVLRRATRGDFDELMPRWVAWVENVETLETIFRGVVNDMIDRGLTKKAIKDSAEYAWWKAQVAKARELPEDLLPTKESGKKYGFNGRNVVRALVDLWRVVKNADHDIGRGGTAPKALNFSGNLIGFREGATIDVWAARLLQRLAGLLRIPSRAESGVSGEMRASGETTLQFGFGQDVFARAAALIRQDASMSRDETLRALNPDDLQALVWFIEKELWTRNNWTSAAGEGGSFEFEADLAGVKDTAKVVDLRRVADSSLSTPEQRTSALRELDAMKRPLSRIIAGLSIQQSVWTQGVDYVPTDADMARTSEILTTAMYEGGARAVVGVKVLSSQGRYGSDIERAFDIEGVFMDGYDAGPLWKTVLEVARDRKQDSTFISRALFESEDVDPAKHVPGLEIYFREARALDKAEGILEQLAGLGVGNYTVIVDARRSPSAIAGAMPAVVGVRFQWIPEFDVRYGGPEAAPATDVELAAKAREKAAEYTDLANEVKTKVAGVSYAKRLWYDTEVRFAHEYQGAIDALADRDVGGGNPRGGEAPWSGRPRREGLQAAARQHEIASRAASERESAASESRDADDRDAGQVTKSPKSGEENASQESVVRGDARRAEEGRQGETGDRREVALRADRDAALARVPEGFSRQVGPATPLVQFRTGAHPITIVGIRYGNAEGLAALDGTKFGTGAKSEEAARIPSWHPLNKRVYFYAQTEDGKIPRSEPVVTAPYVYRSVLGNLYDFETDPENLIEQWRAFKATPEFKASRVDPWTALENAVLAVGYDGYLNRQAGALVVMGRDSVPAEFLGDRGEAWQAITKSPKQRETEEFKRWAGGAEFISREGSLAHEFASGEPVVVETLHGTTGSFTRFSRDRADPEADLGAGFYSTNNPRDVAANYAGQGPDLTNKIMRLVERNYNDEDLEEVGEEFARNQARFELGVEHGGLTMPLYVRFRNPAVLGGRHETRLSYDDRTLERFANAVREAAEGYEVYRLEDALAKLDEGPLRDAKVVVSTMDASDDQGILVGSEIFRQALERMGFDGVIDQTVSDKFRTMDGMDERGTTHFVAFKPNQMKSAIGNRGTFNRGDDITKSPKQWYYSALARAVEQAGMKSAPASAWRDWLRGQVQKGTVKADELEWSGVTDWLGMQQGKVTRDAVASFLAANGVRVEEVVKGNAAGFTQAQQERLDELESLRERTDEEDAERQALIRAENRASDERGDTNQTRFGQWQLPGGKNYRELLLVLPQATPPVSKEDRMLAAGWTVSESQGTWSVVDDKGNLVSQSGSRERAIETVPADWVPQVPANGRQGRIVFPSEDDLEQFLEILQNEGLEHLSYGREADALAVNFRGIPNAAYDRFVNFAELAKGRVTAAPDPTAPRFQSSHFDEPNILAHIRFNERTDADGERVLFVEELQSDWAQTGKRKGFVSKETRQSIPDVTAERITFNEFADKRSMPEAARAAWLDSRNAMRADLKESPINGDSLVTVIYHDGSPAVVTDRAIDPQEAVKKHLRSLQRIAEEKAGIEKRANRDRVPAAPFVGKTEQWVALAMKRVIAYAAEHGFDRVAWTTGDQQADRYDLSEHVDNVMIGRTASGLWEVFAKPIGGGTPINKQVGSVDEVAGIVGKDLADKAKDLEPGAHRDFKGLDLKVGGEGMRAFYDKIVPNVANDVLKKLGGGRVTAVDLTPATVAPSNAELVRTGQWISRDTPQEGGPMAGKQPGFDITDAMRAKAGAGEVPLFSRKIDFRRGDAVVNKRTGETGTVDVVRPRPYTYDDVEFIDSKGDRQTARDTELRHAGTIQRSAKSDISHPVRVSQRLKKLAESDLAPDQIKAVDSERPTDSPDITKSPKSAISNTQIPAAWQATELTEFDAVVRALQDKLVDTKRVVHTIRESGVNVTENIDPYFQELLFHGRAAKRVNDFAVNELRPLLTDMQARGVKMQDLEDFLWAAHAAERNAQIAKVNPSMPDNGSGLTDAQAADILAGLPVTIHGRTIQLDATKVAAYTALQARIDAITNRTLDTLVAYGLESKEMVDTWRKTYRHYVPLRRDMEADSNFLGAFNLGLGTGQGFSVRGPSSRRAMGSERNVVDILANLAMQRERAIVRGEKNRIAQAVYGLATKAPNKDFWLPLNPDLRKITKANAYYAEWKSAEADYNARLAAGVSPNDPAMTSLELKYLTARDNYQNLIPEAQALQTKVEQELVAMGLNPADARSIAREPQERYVDPNTGMVNWRLNPRLAGNPEVVSLRINGENRFVIFSNDERAKAMVTGLKNLDAESLGYLLATSAQLTRWFASVNTQYNPVFGLVNGIRDAGASVLNLGSTPLRGQQAKVLKYAGAALSGIYADLRAHRAGRQPTSVWAQRFEDMGLAGGQTGYRDAFQTSAARADALTRELKALTAGKSKWLKINESNPIFAWLSDYNTAIENAIRVAVFQSAREMGMSDAKAASLAKGITVNFNKKGTAATNTGALYAFFNASVQGTARIGETMLEHKGDPSKAGNLRLTGLGKKIILGGLVLGVMQALLGAAAGWDDDQPPQFQRERNFLIPVPGTDRYVAIPYPLGYHVIPNLGRVATELMLSGGKNAGKRLAQLVGTMTSAFNPIGGGDLIDAITPTVVDPLIALARNKDWTGNPIAREDANKFHPTPGWSRAKDTATPWARGLAYAVNYATGGGAFGKGLASPTPDQIDYLIGQVTGGVGREVGKLAQTLRAPATGEELPLYKVPVIGRFVGETAGGAAVANKFYGNLESIGAHADPIKRMALAHESAKLQQYFRDHPEARLVEAATNAGEKIAELRREKERLVKEGADKARVRSIEERAKLAMSAFNAAVARIEKQKP